METSSRHKGGLGGDEEADSQFGSSSISCVSSQKSVPTHTATLGSTFSSRPGSPEACSSSESSTHEDENDSEYSSEEQSDWSWMETAESKDVDSRLSGISSENSSVRSEDDASDSLSESVSQVASTLESEASPTTAAILILDGEEALRSCSIQIMNLELDSPRYSSNREKGIQNRRHNLEQLSLDQKDQSTSTFTGSKKLLPKPEYCQFRPPCGPKVLSPLLCNGLKGNTSGGLCPSPVVLTNKARKSQRGLQHAGNANVNYEKYKESTRQGVLQLSPSTSKDRPISALELKAKGKISPVTGSSYSDLCKERKVCAKNLQQSANPKHSGTTKPLKKRRHGVTQEEEVKTGDQKGSYVVSKASATLFTIRSDPSQPKVKVPLDCLNRPFPYLIPSPVPGMPDTICFKGTPEEKEAAGLLRFTKRKVFVRYKGIANSPVRLAFMKAGLRCGGSTSKARWHVHWGSMPKREILRRLNRCQLGSRPPLVCSSGKDHSYLYHGCMLTVVCKLSHPWQLQLDCQNHFCTFCVISSGHSL